MCLCRRRAMLWDRTRIVRGTESTMAIIGMPYALQPKYALPYLGLQEPATERPES